MAIRLVPLDGGQPIELAKDMILVGRTEDCDIHIDHKSVSKLHCVLVCTEGLILVRDLGSTNGTRVNGQRIRRAALLPDDQLAIATFRYRVSFGDELESERQPETEVNSEVSPGALRRNALPDEYPGS